MSKPAPGHASEAGEESLVQRPDSQGTIAEDAHAVAAGGGQHVGLDAAPQDEVRRLPGDEPLQTAVGGGPLGFDDLAGGVRGRADVADLARPHQVG